jgi:hypothetical protein
MPTKKTISDPLAGIPTGTARAPRPAPSVINLNAARKRRTLTGQAYKDAQKFARDMVGYDNTSPIWGKRLINVIGDVDARLEDATTALGSGDYGFAEDSLRQAHTYITELKKRLAYGQVMKAQS